MIELIRLLKKIIIKNYNQVRLYSICNLVVFAILFQFISIATDEVFMNPGIVNPMISYNIYAPTVVLAIFSALFIPFTLKIYLNQQRYYLGVLSALGVSTGALYLVQGIECIVILFCSLVGGCFIGSILHIATFQFLVAFFEVSELKLFPSVVSYKTMFFLFLGYCLIGLVFYFTELHAMKLNEWIYGYCSQISNRWKCVIKRICGVTLVVFSVLLLNNISAEYNDLWIPGMVLSEIGIYLFIMDLDNCLIKVKTKMSKACWRLLFADFSSHYKEIRKALFIAAMMIHFSVFFISMSLGISQLVLKNAINYTPFHLQYVEINNHNIIDIDKLEDFCEQEKITIKLKKQIPVLRNSAVNIFSVSDVNSVFKKSYEIPEGQYISLYQYDLNDGYMHNTENMEEISFKEVDGGKLDLKCFKQEISILFNNNYALADRSIIVNDLDYEKLQMIISPELHGIIHMYNFSSWEDSASLVNKLNLYLMSQNQDTSSDERFYLLSSRIEEYGLAKRAGGFLVILAAINWVIFWACSNIVLYYKLQSNMDERTKNYVKLYFVGMEKREIMRIELCKNLIMFLLPCVISLPITLFYSYSVTKIYYQEKVAVICTVIMIMITTVLQLTGYYLYTRIGKNKIDAIR